MQGDDLSILLFWITLAVTFGYEAVKAETTTLRRSILGALAAIFLSSGLFWPQIKTIWPPLTESMASIATSPQSWFALFIFISAILVFGKPRRPKTTSNAASLVVANDDENFKIATQLARQVAELRGKLETISTVHNDTVVASVKLTHEVREKLEKLEKNTANPAPVSNPQNERDILILMDFVVYQSTVLMLDDLLNSAPEDMDNGPLQLGGDFTLKNTLSKEFIELVRRKLDPGSWRRQSFEIMMGHAENSAEYELEQTPMEQRPTGIDPLALRRWVIVHRQCANAIAFLKRDKKEAEENIRNQRFNLLQRYAEQNKS